REFALTGLNDSCATDRLVTGRASLTRFANAARFGAVIMTAALLALTATLDERAAAIAILAIVAAALLGRAWALSIIVSHAAKRLCAMLPDEARSTGRLGLSEQIEAVGAWLRTIDHRFLVGHPVSGLAMREALIAEIAAAGTGILGVLALADFDRLCAFDPALGERVLAATAARLRRMVSGDRFVAHIDRAHLCLWFAGDAQAQTVHAELEAIAYALGEAVIDGDQNILPQILVRHERFAAGESPPHIFVARMLASFAVPVEPGTMATVPHPRHADLARERYALEQDLYHAISRGELQMHYQPLIDTERGCIAGAEALLRWHHAERGLVPPVRFIPIMEAMGLANEIGLWVLNAAIREAQAWQRPGAAPVRVAVNVSGLQLERDDLPVLVQRTLDRHRLASDALEIELTESVATTDTEHCRRIFEALREMGVKLAVDDFGTGYSSFSTLRALAFDKIKIDRAFVDGVDARADSQAICESIIALGRGLGIHVLAEGVETHAEYAWLRHHGCCHFQGYYFGHPMPGAAFRPLLDDTDQLKRLLALGPAVSQRRRKERLRA
ncbi:MAG: diguanylate cyclase, partial [Rhizorhabdus sp.]|nr:diguanylate cyclase [Rhizorhabdus sp.]